MAYPSFSFSPVSDRLFLHNQIAADFQIIVWLEKRRLRLRMAVYGIVTFSQFSGYFFVQLLVTDCCPPPPPPPPPQRNVLFFLRLEVRDDDHRFIVCRKKRRPVFWLGTSYRPFAPPRCLVI